MYIYCVAYLNYIVSGITLSCIIEFWWGVCFNIAMNCVDS